MYKKYVSDNQSLDKQGSDMQGSTINIMDRVVYNNCHGVSNIIQQLHVLLKHLYLLDK